MYLIFILCTAPQNNGAIPILRRMREQHESDSEEEDVIEDVARQYFIYSISVKIQSMSHHVSNFVCDFQSRGVLYA